MYIFAESLLKKALCYTGCTLLTLCSMLCKEPGITILVCCNSLSFVVVMLQFCFVCWVFENINSCESANMIIECICVGYCREFAWLMTGW